MLLLRWSSQDDASDIFHGVWARLTRQSLGAWLRGLAEQRQAGLSAGPRGRVEHPHQGDATPAGEPSPGRVSPPPLPPAQTRFPNRVRRTGRRCGSRGSLEPTRTSPAPSAPDEVMGDRKTNGSVPRPSRRKAEPQRRFHAWFAALSRRTGVSRDQPQE